MLALRLDSMILRVFSHLNDSTILSFSFATPVGSPGSVRWGRAGVGEDAELLGKERAFFTGLTQVRGVRCFMVDILLSRGIQ